MFEEPLNDSLFEAMLSQALKDFFVQELNELPSEEELSETVSISELQEARMKKLFAKAERQERIQAAMKWTRQAAAVVVVVITVLFGSLMITRDVRAAVISTVVHWADGITHFFTNGANLELAAMEPKFIPDGYTESAKVRTEDLIAITYTDSSGSIILLRAIPANSSLEINIVDMEYEQILIKNVIYHVFQSELAGKLNYIVWDTHDRRYYVGAQLPVEQLLEIAQSLK